MSTEQKQTNPITSDNSSQNNTPQPEKPTKGWKSYSRQEKLMVVSIIILVILVILRWDYIRTEAGSAFRSRIETIQGKGMDTLNQPTLRMPTNEE